MDLGTLVSVVLPLAILVYVVAGRVLRKPGDSRRQEALAAFAAAHGLALTAAVKIPPREDWMNFYLFLPEQGAGCEFRNLLRGRVDGGNWIFFDFSLRLGNTRMVMNVAPFRDFTGAVVELAGKTLPSFVMFRRTPWTSLRQDMPEEAHLTRESFPEKNDIKFGDGAFEARYCVQGREPEAVRAMFGPGLRRALLSGTRDWYVEGSGDQLAVYYYSKGKPLPPETDLQDIGGVVKAFCGLTGTGA